MNKNTIATIKDLHEFIDSSKKKLEDTLKEKSEKEYFLSILPVIFDVSYVLECCKSQFSDLSFDMLLLEYFCVDKATEICYNLSKEGQLEELVKSFILTTDVGEVNLTNLVFSGVKALYCAIMRKLFGQLNLNLSFSGLIPEDEIYLVNDSLVRALFFSKEDLHYVVSEKDHCLTVDFKSILDLDTEEQSRVHLVVNF